jgi:hypothetical protein
MIGSTICSAAYRIEVSRGQKKVETAANRRSVRNVRGMNKKKITHTG